MSWCKVGDQVRLLKLSRCSINEQARLASRIGEVMTVVTTPDSEDNAAVIESHDNWRFAVTPDEVCFLIEPEDIAQIHSQLNSILNL